ncbi:MAG: Membrane protein insertase YidC [Alphaproteobacteria bacterium UBA4588]|nr:MAG: Membrane protein insertase YidC [Alphaproteobacteria bacterium UBA4588]
MTPETKNLIAAMSLSLAILIGWQLYFVEPQLEAERAAAQLAAQQVAEQQPVRSGGLNADGTPRLASDAAEAPETDNQDIDKGTRLVIDGPLIAGSISTMGARLDDIVLTSYFETQEEGSPPIKLLLPFDSEQPYFAEFGWVADGTSDIALPQADTIWTAASSTATPSSPLVLKWDNGDGFIFQREIRIGQDYMITVTDSVSSTAQTAVTLNSYSLIRRHGTPSTDGLYILHEGPLGVFDSTLNEEDYDSLQDAGSGGLSYSPQEAGGWVGITDKYWLAALIPDQSNLHSFGMRYLAGQGDRYQTDILGAGQTLAPGQTISTTTSLFAGAKKVTLLDKYADELGIKNFDLAIDFGWFYFLTKPFFYAINWLYGMLGNFGLAIIAFTGLMRLVLFPLANKSYRSMGKMRELSPKIKKMREDFGDDRAKLNQEMMALYKTEKVNPAAGCLPILLQIPIFFALYKVLYVSLEMRHAPFYGWINDLSAVDPTSIFNLFGLLPYSVDMLPSFLAIGIWPILMGISMAIQMRLNPPPPDPIQAKIFQYMPIFFTFLLAGFPAGLVIYWTSNNVLSITQQWWITSSMKKSKS